MIDVKSAIVHMDAVISYLSYISTKKDRCYKKTIDHIIELGEKCQTALDLVHGISGQVNVSSNQTDDCLSDRLAYLEGQLQTILGQSPSMEEVTDSADTSVPELEPVVIDSKSKKQEISNCGKILHKVATAEHVCVESHTCAELLNLWYTKRFFELDTSTCSFKYNISQISEWFEYIVLAYGKSVYTNTESEFVSEFQFWCNSLSIADGKDRKYPLPYCVFSVVRNCKSDDITLASLVLWDMLCDRGLDELASPQFSAIHVHRDALTQRCKKLNKYLLALHEDYKQSEDVFIHSNLTRKEGM